MSRLEGSDNPRRGVPLWPQGAILLAFALCVLLVSLLSRHHSKPPARAPAVPIVTRPLKPSEAAAVLGAKPAPPPESQWHPPHVVKVWLTSYRGRTYRVTQIPRCAHVETVIAYNPRGETLRQAKARLGGMAASTGSFHNPRSMALADFLQSGGRIVSPARTGRPFVAIDRAGGIRISGDYSVVKGKPEASALALGQRLVPLMTDGFSKAFMNRVTDRMAVGLNRNFIFIVQGKTSIWRLSEYLRKQLPVTSAINCDGGHVVRGKGPVHLVFRWRRVSDRTPK